MERQHQETPGRVGPRRRSEPEPAFRQALDALGHVRAHGDLTDRTAAQLRGTVEALRSSGVAGVVLDLRDLRSVDDAALSALQATRAAVEADGGRLTVLSPAGVTPRRAG